MSQDPVDPQGGREAELLRPFVGQWVAQRGMEVLVAADDPRAVLVWLARHHQRAGAMFRVPRGPDEATDLALRLQTT